VEAINSDPDLARAAAANPVLAIEELGFEIAPEARQAIEDRFRFSYRTAVRLRALRRELVTLAGRSFDPDSPADLREILSQSALKRPANAKGEAAKRLSSSATDRRAVQVRWGPQIPDPLEALRGSHPIVEPLLEYRRLEASSPRLAPADLYRDLREGRREIPFVRLRARFKKTRPADASDNA